MLCCVIATCGYAQTTFDFSSASAWGLEDPEVGKYTQIESGYVFNNGNVSITLSYDESCSGFRFFSGTNTGVINLRGYANANSNAYSYMTFTTTDGSSITSIEISGSNLGTANVEGNGWSVGAWSGSASSVSLKVIKSTVQFNSIKVYTGGEAPAVVDISNTPETAYTTTKAVELINAGEGLSTEVYVKGTVTQVSEFNESYGDMNYYITDGTTEFYIYNGYNLGGNKFESADDLQDGDVVIVYGKLALYTNPEGESIYEMGRGNKLYSLNGKTDSGETPDTPTDDITNTPETAYTPAQANAYCEAGYTTAVYVKGIITSIKSIDVSKYERAQYYIGETVDATETFYIYNGYYLEGKAFTSNDQIKVGDEVIVYGNLDIYKGTYEMAANNYIYSLNGKTQAEETPGEEYTVTGAGTLENP